MGSPSRATVVSLEGSDVVADESEDVSGVDVVAGDVESVESVDTAVVAAEAAVEFGAADEGVDDELVFVSSLEHALARTLAAISSATAARFDLAQNMSSPSFRGTPPPCINRAHG